jgi:hypothetical protein
VRRHGFCLNYRCVLQRGLSALTAPVRSSPLIGAKFGVSAPCGNMGLREGSVFFLYMTEPRAGFARKQFNKILTNS